MRRNERGRQHNTVSRQIRQEIRSKVNKQGVEGYGTEVTVPDRSGAVLDLTPQHVPELVQHCYILFVI